MAEHVLITGGAGFIGLHLTRSLLADGHAVTLVDDFSRAVRDDELRTIAPNVTLVDHDLTRPLPASIGRHYTQVYHLAARVGVRYSNEVPHQVMRTNLLSTINVLDHLAHMPRTTLCFASTSEVYAQSVAAGLAPIPTPEAVPVLLADPAAPRLSYTASKISGEMMSRHYACAFGFNVRIVRYHNVYGPRMGYDHVIPQFIERTLRRPAVFDIYGATQKRAFCYVDDAVRATRQVMDLPITESLVVNLGNDQEEIEMQDVARLIFDMANYHPAFRVNPPPAGSPDRRVPDLTTLRRLTGYQPSVSLAEGVRRTYAWYSRALRSMVAS